MVVCSGCMLRRIFGDVFLHATAVLHYVHLHFPPRLSHERAGVVWWGVITFFGPLHVDKITWRYAMLLTFSSSILHALDTTLLTSQTKCNAQKIPPTPPPYPVEPQQAFATYT